MTSKNFAMLPSQRLLAGNSFITEKDAFLTQAARKKNPSTVRCHVTRSKQRELALLGKRSSDFQFDKFCREGIHVLH